MGGGGSAPQFNSGQVAQQQQQANVDTGVANAFLNNTNQVTPYGNLTYDQTGSVQIGGSAVPQFTATQTLSPEQQKIYEQTTGIQNQALGIAPGLLSNVQNAVSQPLDFSGAPAVAANGQQLRDTAYEALMGRGRQEIDRTRALGETQAANQGIAPGSEAWRRQTQGFDQALTDLSQQSTINAGTIAGQDLSQSQALRNQYINEMLTQRTQPISDLTALLGFGGGVQQPQYANTPQSQIPATDVTTPAMQAYQGQLNAYNQNIGQQNSLMGGLFGLGGSALKLGGMFAMSDVRVKEDISPVGETYDGQNLYAYRYKGDPTPRVGLMAQEVEQRDPGAVLTLPSGLKAVNYERALAPARGLFGLG